MAYRSAIELLPKPLICGKMNHIPPRIHQLEPMTRWH